MRFLFLWRSILVLYFCIDPTFRLIINPFANKQFVLFAEVVRSLTFSFVIYPMTFEVISVSFGQNSIPISLTLMPLTLIDVFIRINHSSFTLWFSHSPKTIVSISVRTEQSASSMSFILNPISRVLSLELTSDMFPIGSLAMSLVLLPHSFVFVSVFVNLDAKALLHVFFPISDVLCGGDPFFSFNCSVFLLCLLFDPVDGSMWTVLLSFLVILLPSSLRFW